MILRAAILNQASYKNRIEQLASQLELPIVDAISENDFDCLLHFSGELSALSISIPAHPQWQPFFLDFTSGATNWRREHGGGELLVRAIQGRKKDADIVWDATAGLGRDSFVLASHGFTVQMFERNPFVSALLSDAVERALHTEDSELGKIFSRMNLIVGNVQGYLENFLERNLENIKRPDVIYLDPMFPESKNSALVKKNMQVFHRLVGADDDAHLLLAPARRISTKRVVVKRPLKAPFLADEKPAYQLTGKSIRFDVYLPV